MKSLTKRQSQILTLISSFTQAKGYAPSYRELLKALALRSPGTLYKHIKNLKEQGYLKKTEPPKKAPKAAINVPIIGQVAKGDKMELFAKVSFFELPPSMKTNINSNLYGFVVKDHSFANLQMQRGDLLLVDSAKEPQNGEMILAKSAMHGSQIGRYIVTYTERCLQSHIQEIDGKLQDESLSLDKEGTLIQGVIIALLRKY
jgi:repressor LexA